MADLRRDQGLPDEVAPSKPEEKIVKAASKSDSDIKASVRSKSGTPTKKT